MNLDPYKIAIEDAKVANILGIKNKRFQDLCSIESIENLVNEIERLRKGFHDITEIRPPLDHSGTWSWTQVLAMSPTQLIQHCNEMIGSKLGNTNHVLGN